MGTLGNRRNALNSGNAALRLVFLPRLVSGTIICFASCSKLPLIGMTCNDLDPWCFVYLCYRYLYRMILGAYSVGSCSRNAAAVAGYSILIYTHNTPPVHKKHDITIAVSNPLYQWFNKTRTQTLYLSVHVCRAP